MKTITFYSYKGGVGRSLALANIATRLSEFNKKVCLIDFDLEAPGLHYKLGFDKSKIQKGIVDYVYEFTNNGYLPHSITDFSINFDIHPNKNLIHMIPAGTLESKEYWKKLSSINWHDLLYEEANGIAFFLDLKEKIKKELNPDFLLIDSRTGISEISGITLSLFADEVVLVAANNSENLEGAKKLMSSITNSNNSLFGKVPKIYFVLSRVPFGQTPIDKNKENSLIKRTQKFLGFTSEEQISIIHSDRELEENEKVKIGDERDGNSSQIAKDYLNLFEKVTKDTLTSVEVQKFIEIKEAERRYQKALKEENLSTKLELIHQSVALNPQNIDYKEYEGRVLATLNRLDEALVIFDQIIKTDDNRLTTYISYGQVLISQKKFDEAIDFFSKLLPRFPDVYLPYYYIASAYTEIRQFDKAIELYTKALEISPEIAAIYNNRGNCYKHQGDLNLALADVYKGIELNNQDAILFATLAEIYAHLRQTNEFYVFFEIALEKDAKGIEKSIIQEPEYANFKDEEKFKKLLTKYNITFPEYYTPPATNGSLL